MCNDLKYNSNELEQVQAYVCLHMAWTTTFTAGVGPRKHGGIMGFSDFDASVYVEGKVYL